MEVAKNVWDAHAAGSRLRAFRESLSLSQPQLGAAVEGTKRAIQDNELGKTSPNSRLLFALAQLGLNVNWLLTGDGPMALADLAVRDKQTQPIDEDLLIYVIEALDAELKRKGADFTPRKMAEMAAFLYDQAKEAGQRDRSMVARLVRMQGEL